MVSKRNVANMCVWWVMYLLVFFVEANKNLGEY